MPWVTPSTLPSSGFGADGRYPRGPLAPPPPLQRHLGPGMRGKLVASSFTLRQPQQGPSAFCSSMMSNLEFYWASTPAPNHGSCIEFFRASLVAQMVKNPPAMWETWVGPWVGKIPWRRPWQPTPAFSWRIPWTEEPGGLQSMGSHRVRQLSD